MQSIIVMYYRFLIKITIFLYKSSELCKLKYSLFGYPFKASLAYSKFGANIGIPINFASYRGNPSVSIADGYSNIELEYILKSLF